MTDLFKNIKANKERLLEIIRFGIVGVVSTVITYGVYYLFLLIFNPTLSYTIGYLVAFVINYLLTTMFTFKVKANKKNGLGFVISNIINYLLSGLFLNLFIWLGVSKELAPIPMFAVCIPTNFLLVRFVMKK